VWILAITIHSQSLPKELCEAGKLTGIATNILVNRPLDLTRHRLLVCLAQKFFAMVVIATCIQRSLESIAFPPKNVVTMVSVAGSAPISTVRAERYQP
jgi:hypothetical protein